MGPLEFRRSSPRGLDRSHPQERTLMIHGTPRSHPECRKQQFYPSFYGEAFQLSADSMEFRKIHDNRGVASATFGEGTWLSRTVPSGPSRGQHVLNAR